MRGIVASNEEAFAMIEKGLERPICLAPELDDYMDPIGPIGKWLGVGRLLRLKAELELFDGRNSQAAETAILQVRFGDLIQHDASTLIGYLVGVAILDMGLTEVQAIARDDSTSGEVLDRLSSTAAKTENLSRGLKRGMKAEYGFADNAIKELEEGKAEDFGSFSGMDSIPFPKDKKIPTYFFQPNKTRSILADSYRNVISNAPLPYAEMDFSYIENIKSELVSQPANKLKLIMRPNILCRIFMAMIFPAFEDIVQRKCQIECNLAATRIIVALHSYKSAQGEFPATMEKLVPTYLAEIPRDPFDGKRFRYDRESGIIYSVGEDTTDAGGSTHPQSTTTDNRWDAKDAVFKIGN